MYIDQRCCVILELSHSLKTESGKSTCDNCAMSAVSFEHDVKYFNVTGRHPPEAGALIGGTSNKLSRGIGLGWLVYCAIF